MIFSEPLHTLTRPNHVGYYSIPRVESLPVLDERSTDNILVSFPVPNESTGRLSFLMLVLPIGHEVPSSGGMILTHEMYSVFIGLFDPTIPGNIGDRFVTGFPTAGPFVRRQVEVEEAETEFFWTVNPDSFPISRESNGS